MLDADILLPKNDSDHIEPIGVARLLKPRHPDFRGPAELTLLSPIDGAHGSAKISGRARLHLDEGYSASRGWLWPDGNQINVSMPVPESSLRDLPSVDVKPLLGHPLTADPHRLPFATHGPNLHHRVGT